VFDVSDFLHYHPGGAEELMKGAGQDATSLFNQIHRWVNFESILKANFLGFLVNEPTFALVRSLKSQIISSSQLLPTTKFSEDDDCVFLEVSSTFFIYQNNIFIIQFVTD
jgi:cytochrome b involved in lipid metabolism